MKDFWKSWKFWLIVVTVLLVIVGVILYFTVPAFKVVVWEAAAGLLLLVTGWLIGHFTK